MTSLQFSLVSILIALPAITSFTDAYAQACLPRPVSCVRTSPYGMRFDPLNKTTPRAHQGTDYGCAQGTSVQSVMNGYVEFAGWSNDGGYMVTVVDGAGLRSRYLHNASIGVTNGQKIQAGQVISLSGNTGHRTTGPHLHFMILTGPTTTIDPESRLCGGSPAPPPPVEVVSAGGGSMPPSPQAGLNGSPRAILLDIISSRSLNTDYSKQLAGMPEERLYSEISYLEAAEIRTGTEKLRIKERIGSLIAARTALKNDDASRSNLDSRRTAAIGSFAGR